MWMKKLLMHMLKKKMGSMAGKLLSEPELISASSKMFFGGAIASIVLSVIMSAKGDKDKAVWIGLWAPTLLLLGLYDRAYKMMKLFKRF